MPAPNFPDQSRQSFDGLGNLVERITPWLFEVGSWVFGGLIALHLIVIASLITVGPVDRAILISMLAFACALPLNVAGILLLRLTKDIQDIGIESLALQAFREADFPDIEAYFPPAHQAGHVRKRRARVALWCAAAIAVLSLALTVAGLVAAFWHMAWWIGVAFAAMIVLSSGIVLIMIARSLPPESAAEQALKRRYRRRAHHVKSGQVE